MFAFMASIIFEINKKSIFEGTDEKDPRGRMDFGGGI